MAAADRGEVIFMRGQDDESDVWDDTALIEAYDLAVERLKSKISPNEEEGKTKETVAGNEDSGLKKRKQKSMASKAKRKNKKAKKSKGNSQKIPEWKVGDECQAVFTEDGLLYEAVINSIDNGRSTCVVEYIGYGNLEEQELQALRPTNNDFKEDAFHSESEQGSRRMSAGSNSSTHRIPRPKTPTPPTWPWPDMPPMFHGPSPMPGMMPGMPSFPSFPGFPGFGMPSMPPPPPMIDEDMVEDKEALYSMLISWYMSGYHTGFYQGLKQGQLKAKQHGFNRSQRRQSMQQGSQYSKQSKG